MSESKAPRRITRRTVVKGAAWAIPAVPLVVATPAYASSGKPPSIIVGDACKLPGNSCGNVFVKGYVFELTLTNNTALDMYLYNETGYLITITENNPDINLFFQSAVNATTGEVIEFPYLLAAGETIFILLNAGENGSSANESITGTISFPWGHTADPQDDEWDHPNAVANFTYAATPPIQNPGCLVTLPPNCGK